MKGMLFSVADQPIRVNVPDWYALADHVVSRMERREGFALATLNLDHLVKLREPGAFRDAYAAQDLITADGNPIVWMSRLAGRPVKLIPGSNMIIPLARMASNVGVTVALFGSTEEALAEAKAYMEGELRGLNVVCCIAPPMGFDPAGPEAEAMLKQIEASGAGLCFVALGAPKQEIFAALGRRVTPGLGFASIGAGLDFFAGRQKRAPQWMQRLALEWLWRMALDPKRMTKRYLKCMAILPRQMAQAAALRLSRHKL
ncbi:WecB/TagA/CpsF family glycosyltransferase [Ponticoccus alexandrii]|nr:WecB/TagA/CpsF family glycosyltransferase [Enemella evansiae]